MRKHTRRKAGFDVLVGIPGGPQVPGAMALDARDLSEGGAFLRSQLLFEEGELLTLAIPLPSGKTISATGRVARVEHNEGEEPGMGIKFVELPEDDRLILAANLNRLMGRRK